MFFWIHDGRITPNPPVVREPRVLSVGRLHKATPLDFEDTESNPGPNTNLFRTKPASAYAESQESGKSTFFVSDIMNSLVFSLESEDNIQKALKEMQKREIRHLPITNTKGKLIGFLSERDILEKRFLYNDDTELSKIMTKHVLACKPSAEIRQVAKTLIKERIGCMPIVDEEYKLLGIVTRSDLLRLLVEHPDLNILI